MARYLRSLASGCVLPYIDNTVKAGGVVELTLEQAAAYEATLAGGATKVAKPAKVAKPVAVVEPQVGEVLIEDFDPVSDLLGALEAE